MGGEREELIALAERCEKAVSACRELDGEIARSFGWKQQGPLYWWTPENVTEARRRRRGIWAYSPVDLPAFSASLDAAKTLMLPNALHSIRQLWDGESRRAWQAMVQTYSDPPRMWTGCYEAVSDGEDGDARALTAACLRALAHPAAARADGKGV